MRLYLDDIRPTPEGFDLRAWDAPEAIKFIDQGGITFISFDHDLGEADKGTGYDVAKFIEMRAWAGIKPPKYEVHSANPVGALNIERAMNQAFKYYYDYIRDNNDQSHQ
jgi:hypothetical protein